jgi:hypothetical protein
MLVNKLIDIMNTNHKLMRDLHLVKSLELPEWHIASGYVRNFVWDHLHGNSNPTPFNDVDVLYFDPSDLSVETERQYDKLLKFQISEYNWSVKNQARMHLRNGESPYISVSDAMKRWPETATATGISLDDHNNVKVIAPHGLDDLFDLVIRRSPYFKDKAYFYKRVQSKRWQELWPQLILVE